MGRNRVSKPVAGTDPYHHLAENFEAVEELRKARAARASKRHVIPQPAGQWIFNNASNMNSGVLGLTMDTANGYIVAHPPVPVGAVVHAVTVVGLNPAASIRALSLDIVKTQDFVYAKQAVVVPAKAQLLTANLRWSTTLELPADTTVPGDSWLYLRGQGGAGVGTSVHIFGAFWTASFPESYW